jgi:hypothetical protein
MSALGGAAGVLAIVAVISGSAAPPLADIANFFGMSAQAQSREWTTYQNTLHGFSIAYPRARFSDQPANESDDGRLVLSRDGQAQLLVGAFVNEEKTTLAAYRDYLLENNYRGATLDYAPIRDRWFVLSGTRDGTMFYERVSFMCGGQLINSWALLYPAEARRTWDPVVERIARTYSPGAGRDGECG